MSITHNWKINKVFCSDYPKKTISKVELLCATVNDEGSREDTYTVSIPDNSTEETFVAFTELTETEVKKWCGSLAEKETEFATALTNQLAEPIEYVVPWFRSGDS